MSDTDVRLRSNFAHHRLQPLCMAIDSDIIAVTYGVCGGSEYVYLIFEGGYKEIDVTGLNLREMSLVVLDDIDDNQSGQSNQNN